MKDIDFEWLDPFTARDSNMLRTAVRKALKVGDQDCILHPLGFYFVRLAKRGDVSIRLHYWPANDRRAGTALTPYHDHVWKLCSCILYGQIENVLIDVEEDESGGFHIATIAQAGGVDEVIAQKATVTTRVRSRDAYVTDNFYEMEPRLFHCTDVAPGKAAITLVRSEVMIEGGPRTLVPVGFGEHAPSREPLTSSIQLLGEISQILS